MGFVRQFTVFLVIAFLGSAPFSEPASALSLDAAAETSWPKLHNSVDLNAELQRNDDVQIIDIRSKKYLKRGIIPGATWIPFKEWRGPKSRPGQPPTEEDLARLLSENGVKLDQPIVVHNHSGSALQTGRSAIVYWLLKSAGANQISILKGGFKAWAAQDLPKVAAHSTPNPTEVEISYRRDWWADPVHIFGVTTAQSKGAILDARLDAQVRKSVETGKPMKSMPMARYMPASMFTNPMSESTITEDGKAAFRASLEARGINLGEGFLISVCQTGELSALSWFYSSEIVGIENVLYYPDALQGWKSDGGYMFGLRTN